MLWIADRPPQVLRKGIFGRVAVLEEGVEGAYLAELVRFVP